MEKAFDWGKKRASVLFPFKFKHTWENILCHKITLYVRLNSMLNTDWFPVQNGVKQGDPLSSKLFCLFMNSLVDQLNQLGIGVETNGTILCTLLYADDIILIAKTEAELQSLLLALEEWCNLWQLYVNVTKTKIMHFRNPRKKISTFKFILNGQELEKVSCYKYLGSYLNEHMNTEIHSDYMEESVKLKTF